MKKSKKRKTTFQKLREAKKNDIGKDNRESRKILGEVVEESDEKSYISSEEIIRKGIAKGKICKRGSIAMST